MTRPSPPWHAECRRLRAEGHDKDAIAQMLGKGEGAVRWVLNEHNEKRGSLRRAQLLRMRRTGVAPRTDPDLKLLSRPVRIIKKIIDREAIGNATRLFAAGEIDRDHMMRLIDGVSA